MSMLNISNSRVYTVFPIKYIYNLIGTRLLGTKSIPIEVGIVWFCITNVHPEGIAHLHDFHDMTHHRHSM